MWPSTCTIGRSSHSFPLRIARYVVIFKLITEVNLSNYCHHWLVITMAMLVMSTPISTLNQDFLNRLHQKTVTLKLFLYAILLTALKKDLKRKVVQPTVKLQNKVLLGGAIQSLINEHWTILLSTVFFILLVPIRSILPDSNILVAF